MNNKKEQKRAKKIDHYRAKPGLQSLRDSPIFPLLFIIRETSYSRRVIIREFVNQKSSSTQRQQDAYGFALQESQRYGAEVVGIHAERVIVPFDPAMSLRNANRFPTIFQSFNDVAG